MGRIVLAVMLAALAAGCGSASQEGRVGSGTRTVDRPAPDAYERWANPPYEVTISSGSPCVGEGEQPPECDDEDWKTWGHCGTGTEQARTDPVCEPYRQLVEETRREYERWVAQLAPAEGSDPRVVAERDVADGRTVELVAWRTASGRVCTVGRLPGAEIPPQFLGGCLDARPCDHLCPGFLVLEDRRYVLTGTVAANADAIRVTTENGDVALHEVDGPTVLGADRRALLIELGADPLQKVEALDDGNVIGAFDLSDPYPGEGEAGDGE